MTWIYGNHLKAEGFLFNRPTANAIDMRGARLKEMGKRDMFEIRYYNSLMHPFVALFWGLRLCEG